MAQDDADAVFGAKRLGVPEDILEALSASVDVVDPGVGRYLIDCSVDGELCAGDAIGNRPTTEPNKGWPFR